MCLAHNLPHAAVVQCTEQSGGGAPQWLQANVARNAHLRLAHLRCAVLDWADFEAPATAGRAQQPRGRTGSIEDAAVTRTRRLDVESEGGVRDCTEDEASSSADAAFDIASNKSRQAFHAAPRHVEGLEADECERITSAADARWDVIVGSDLMYNDEGVRQLPQVFAHLARTDTRILYAHTKRRFEHLDADFFHALSDAGLAWREVRERWAPAPPASPPPFDNLFPEMRIAVYLIQKQR